MVDTLACDLVSYVKRKERENGNTTYYIDSSIIDRLMFPFKKINSLFYNAFIYSGNKIISLKANNQEDAISLLMFLFKKYPLLTFLTTFPDTKRYPIISSGMFKKYLLYLNTLKNYLDEIGNSRYISNIDLNIVASRFSRNNSIIIGKYNASLFKQSSPSFWRKYRDKDVNKKKSSILYFLFKIGILKFEKSVSIQSYHGQNEKYYNKVREILKSYSLYSDLPNHLLPKTLIIYKVNYSVLNDILDMFKAVENYRFLFHISNLKRLFLFSLFVAKRFGISEDFKSHINITLNDLFVLFYDFSSVFLKSRRSNILFEFEKEKSLVERVRDILNKQRFVYFSHYRHLKQMLIREVYSKYVFDFNALFQILDKLERLLAICLPLIGSLYKSFQEFKKELEEIMQSCLSKTKKYLNKVMKITTGNAVIKEMLNLIDMSTKEDIILLRNVFRKVEPVVKIMPHKVLKERNREYIQMIHFLNNLACRI